MTYSIRFLPEVEDDVIAGYAWYESKSLGLGEEFLRTFYAAAGDISRHHLLYPKVHEEIRRCLLRRFPYAIYYKAERNHAIVLGLFHCARNPRSIHIKMHKRQAEGKYPK